MMDENSFDSRLSQLEKFEKSQNYLEIINSLDKNYDSHLHQILEKWMSYQILSQAEKNYIDLYSKIQLSCVKYCLINWLTIDNVQAMIEKLPGRLIEKKQLKALEEAIIFIRGQPDDGSTNADEDIMLPSIMRMIDARSFAYQCCTDKSYAKHMKPFCDELQKFLQYKTAKKYLKDVKSSQTTHQNTSLGSRHQFIMGCCPFAVARSPEYKGKLSTQGDDVKYVYVLAKYVRSLVNKPDFAQNQSFQYCVRGILTLLSNYTSPKDWLDIMNEALADETNEALQERNPFNIDLFSSIVRNILGSNTFQKKAQESASNDESLLLDITVVFLVHWSDTQTSPDDDDEETQVDTGTSSALNKPNQLLHLFNATSGEFQDISQIIIPYIDAKYDRLRLMASSLLSNIMSAKDFSNLQNSKESMAKDLIKLIFDSIKQARKQPDEKYKGIGFDKLLDYLFRFLIQDFIKEETIPYISQLVEYAHHHHILVLRILRRISIHPKLTDKLLSNQDLKQFLQDDADAIYRDNPKFYKIITDIRKNLTPLQPTEPLPTTDNDGRTSQAFISYCHRDKDTCVHIHNELEKQKLFGKIWIDKYDMKDDMFLTIPTAISQSRVLIVLLSDNYCQSDMCRREWIFAVNKKIKVFVISVQTDFDRHKYDWVEFTISDGFYYRLKDNDAIPKIIRHSREFLNLKTEQEELPPSKSLVDTSHKGSEMSINRDYQNKRPISTWTPEDIQNWCNDNQLKQWCEPLLTFNGTNLLSLRRDLSNDSRIPYILKGNNLNGLDVIRLKDEIDKLLAKEKAVNIKTEPEKPIMKRRISKTANK